jgi:hypothetical protein
MTARHTLSNPYALTDSQLRAELSIAIAAHHYPRHAYAQRTFSTAAHVRQVTPSPADPGVGGELLRVEG